MEAWSEAPRGPRPREMQQRQRASFYSTTKVPLVRLLSERECLLDEHYRDQLTCSAIHLLLLHPSMKFQHMWTKVSKQTVCIGLDRRIYFNHHRECYFNDGCGGVPHKMYQLVEERSKIWAAVAYHCHIRCKPTTEEEKEVCLVVLTSDGFLKVLHADTGVVLRSIYLSTEIVFRYLLWSDYLNTIQVKSVQASRQDRVALPPGGRERVLSLMLFKIHPLELIAYMHIHKQVFGNDVRDVSIAEDLLVVTLHNRTVRYYSFAWILENCQVAQVKLGRPVNTTDWGTYIAGVYPNSIPVTVVLNEAPPLLFETKCNPEVGISFGGLPTVYIHSPGVRGVSEFLIRSLSTGQLVGRLASDTLTFHQDVAEFHFEDYQRLLHISGCELSCYQIVCDSKLKQSLKLVYKTNFKEQPGDNIPLVSSRGRLIRKRKSTSDTLDDFSSAIQDLDYENELELMYAVVTLPDGEETAASLCFIDDHTGQVTKRVPLPTWVQGAGNSIYYELDCIVHLVSDGGKSTCHYYRLTRTSSTTNIINIDRYIDC